MGADASIHPFINERPISLTPLKPGESRSGMYFREGTHTLTIKTNSFTLKPVNIHIQHEEVLTAVAFHSINEKGDLTPQLIALNNTFPPAKAQTQPLRIRSFSSRDLYLDLGFQKVMLYKGKSVTINGWNGESFPVKHKQHQIAYMRVEEVAPHSMIVWDAPNDEVRTTFLDHRKTKLPDGLKEDLTFGPSRDELPFLQPLKKLK